MANWNLGIVSPTSSFENESVNLLVATTALYIINPSNPVPPIIVNWNLGIISSTAYAVNQSVALKGIATNYVIAPSNPVPPFEDYTLGIDKPTYRGWLWGRRPVTGLQFPRGVYNY
jgi:hypothetical protein